MTPSKGTDRHSFRIKRDLWQAATEAARQNDETLSDVVRAALERYVEENRRAGRPRG